MLYNWRGPKPHRRHRNIQGDHGLVRIQPILIAPGEAFEPTPEELAAFGDLLEPVDASLRSEEATDL